MAPRVPRTLKFLTKVDIVFLYHINWELFRWEVIYLREKLRLPVYLGHSKGNGHFLGFRGGGALLWGGWTVLDDLFLGVLNPKKEKKWIWPSPPKGGFGRGDGKNWPYYLKLICLVKCSRSFEGTIIEPRQTNTTQQILDRQTLDTTNPTYKTQQTLDILNATYVLCFSR